MPTFDNIFKHIAGEFSQDFAVLALKTSDVEVTGKLNTEHITVKTHRSDMVYHVRLPDDAGNASVCIIAFRKFCQP